MTRPRAMRPTATMKRTIRLASSCFDVYPPSASSYLFPFWSVTSPSRICCFKEFHRADLEILWKFLKNTLQAASASCFATSSSKASSLSQSKSSSGFLEVHQLYLVSGVVTVFAWFCTFAVRSPSWSLVVQTKCSLMSPSHLETNTLKDAKTSKKFFPDIETRSKQFIIH